MEEQKNIKSPTENGVKYGTAAALLATGAMFLDNSLQTEPPEKWKHMDCTPEMQKAINPKAPEIIFHPKLAQLIEQGNFNYQTIKNALGDDVKKNEHGEYISIGIKSEMGMVFLPHYISENDAPVGKEKFEEIAKKIKIAIREKNASCSAGSRLV